MITSLKIFWVRIILTIQNVVIKIARALLFKHVSKKSKILIFRTGSIGDSICAFPALVAIRNYYKESQIDILTNAGGSNLVSLDKLLSPEYFDNVIDYSGYSSLELWKIIKKEKYDLIIELPQDQVSLFTELRNMFFFKTAGIKSGWGWQVVTCFSFRQTQDRYVKFYSETNRLLMLLEKHGVAVSKNRNKYPISWNNEDEKLVISLMGDILTKSEIRRVAIVPGAKRPQNRYPFERFFELATWLTDQGYYVVVIGGPDDKERGEALATIKNVISFCGLLTPSQSAVLLTSCSITISNDTGPMHLSYAVGTPVIGLFSSRDFQKKWFPPEGNVALRKNDIACSLCFSETCANNICMQSISLEEIKEQFMKLKDLKYGA